MLNIHPQYIKDANGKDILVFLTIQEFNSIISELEELKDIGLYDNAKKSDDGERIPMEQAFEMIDARRDNDAAL